MQSHSLKTLTNSFIHIYVGCLRVLHIACDHRLVDRYSIVSNFNRFDERSSDRSGKWYRCILGVFSLCSKKGTQKQRQKVSEASFSEEHFFVFACFRGIFVPSECHFRHRVWLLLFPSPPILLLLNQKKNDSHPIRFDRRPLRCGALQRKIKRGHTTNNAKGLRNKIRSKCSMDHGYTTYIVYVYT